MYQSQQSARSWTVFEASVNFGTRTEQALADWWFRQAEKAPLLITTGGEPLIILAPGRLNDGPGPDVHQAHLILGDREISGSVEFHVESQDWYRHGHHLDPSYQDVILHLVGKDSGKPDLPTLIVNLSLSGTPSCIARRPVSRSEMLEAAWLRFNQKSQHVEKLGQAEADGLNRYLLGLLEILCSGPRRSPDLHLLARELGWQAWPDTRPWMGSFQGYSFSERPHGIIRRVLERTELFAPASWSDQGDGHIRDWRSCPNRFRDLGVNQNQFREWIVNIVAPSWPSESGFALWSGLPPFREYGFEKKLRARLGLGATESIAQQQALIWWSSARCRPRHCHKCCLRCIH